MYLLTFYRLITPTANHRSWSFRDRRGHNSGMLQVKSANVGGKTAVRGVHGQLWDH